MRLGAAWQFGLRREERSVLHTEGQENALAQDFAERRAGDDLDDPSEHVGRKAVFPYLAGLITQRQRGERFDMFRRSLRLAHHALREYKLLNQRIPGEPVG